MKGTPRLNWSFRLQENKPRVKNRNFLPHCWRCNLPAKRKLRNVSENSIWIGQRGRKEIYSNAFFCVEALRITSGTWGSLIDIFILIPSSYEFIEMGKVKTRRILRKVWKGLKRLEIFVDTKLFNGWRWTIDVISTLVYFCDNIDACFETFNL